MQAKRVAIVLSGCGYKDGSEITEAVSALVALSQSGAQTRVFAPADRLEMAARIARDKIQDWRELKADDFDALLWPGGFGAAQRFCTWADDGARCSVDPEAERILRAFYQTQKPIGAICIAPALVARVLGRQGITVTLGADPANGSEIAKTGAIHENCGVDDFISDREHRVITTPAYMYADAQPHEVFHGISKMIRELVEMA